MRIALLLTPQTDFVWNPSDQHKMHGLIWNALKGTSYEKLHDDSATPTFAFSNVFPVGGYTTTTDTVQQGTDCMVLISSPHPGLIDAVASNLTEQDYIEIGDIQFTLDGIEEKTPKIGPVGTTGTLKVQTGLYLRLPTEEQEKYGITHEYTADTISWTPDHGMKAFRNRLLDNAQWKIQRLMPHMQQTPQSFTDLFDSVELKATYEASVNVTTNYTYTFFPTVCELSYTVATETQRKWLNTLLDTGLGWRNSLGFGFTNIITSNRQ